MGYLIVEELRSKNICAYVYQDLFLPALLHARKYSTLLMLSFAYIVQTNL